MSQVRLYKYFCSNARYMEDAPPNAKYYIRYGNTSLHSGDTKELFEAFVKRVREFKMPALPHIWNPTEHGSMICSKCNTKAKTNVDGSISSESLTEACPVRTKEYKKS